MAKSIYKNIPANIITGFLGVGKTTAILNLLKDKPEDERWAILVNEFGEVGIDGGVIKGTEAEKPGVFIREIPGGCMCCSSRLPMQIALNMLLSKAKPHRLLIEPTGLGHPKEVIDTLNDQHYRGVLDLRNTITLVDARNISDQRYKQHDIFKQQLDVADVIVANKSDQYNENDFDSLIKYLNEMNLLSDKTVHQVSHGQLSLQWLEGHAAASAEGSHHHHDIPVNDQNFLENVHTIPECGYLTIENQGGGFFSQGWVFKPDYVFNKEKVYQLLAGLVSERVKGIFITEQGVINYNKAGDVLTEVTLDEAMDSRVEIIASDRGVFPGMSQDLLNCIKS